MLRGGAELLRMAAFELLVELEGSRLEVVLLPAPDPRHSGHMVRAVCDQNAAWYRDFCSAHQSSRRRRRANDNDTRIRRRETVRALERVMRGDVRGAYAERLRPYLEEKAREIGPHVSAHAPAPRAAEAFALKG